MKVVCIDTNIEVKFGGDPYLSGKPLEYGKVYQGELIFNIDGKTDWKNNYLNLDGWNKLDWFPTKNFVTLDVWREKVLSEIVN